MSEAQVAEEVAPKAEEPEGKFYRYKLHDGTEITVPIPKDAEERKRFSPFVWVDPESRLPEVDYPVTAIAKLAMQSCPTGNLDYFAKELGVTVEQVKEWIANGLDPAKQWRGRIPVSRGQISEPRNADDIRMIAIHMNHFDGSVVWSPDWTCGEKLYRGLVSMVIPGDKRPERWRENFKRNSPFPSGVRDLRGSWRGKPLILMGNSPSVGKQLDTIRSIAGHRNAKIVGCNRGVSLLGKDVLDYLVILDYECRQDWFEGIEAGKTELVSYVASSSMVKDYWPADRIRWCVSHIAQPDFPEEAEVGERLGFLVHGGSVAVSMLWLAYYWLEANPIILCGFDHAFPMYEGYPGKPLMWGQNRDLMLTEEFGTGRVIVTTQGLLDQRIQLDSAAMWCRKSGRRVINCTEGGILKNPDRMPLKDAIQKFVIDGKDPMDNDFLELKRRQFIAMNPQPAVTVGG